MMNQHKTDKDLLELAAKACNWILEDGDDEEGLSWIVWGDNNVPMFGWSPLTDDGDALRLAVKIAEVQGYFPLLIDKVCAKTSAPDGTYVFEFVPNGGCFAAATRRAIVRAAAEIGKTL